MNQKDEIFALEDLLIKVSEYNDRKEDLKLITEAFNYASDKHTKQERLTGDAYINHPLNVALILTDVKADADTISAALLHDVLNYTDTTIEDIRNAFSEDVSNLVDGITKINKLSLSAENDALANYHKKILVGLSKDVRIIILKLADRLHNMRTLWVLPENKRREKAKETLEILAPIAHRLGLQKIKSELEELCLKYYKPDIYFTIAEQLNATKIERDNAVIQMINEVSEILNSHNIKHEIKGRAKSIYSIYTKLQKGKKFNDIFDLLALRILVDTEAECYLALGLIHAKFKPMPKRFKDYIANPKTNLYQSLHTTVFGIGEDLFEIQIRTYEMDKVAEYGIASHWSYKENIDGSVKNTMEQKLEMFRSIMELDTEELSNEEFVNQVKDDVLNENIYVYTPKGDVIELPTGSTPIDFAYKVHSKVGDKMVGAIVNNNIVPLDYVLNTSDIVKVNVNNNSKGPSKEWINMVKTNQARNKIRAFYAKMDHDENITKGKESLLKELRKQKIVINDFLTENNINYLCDELNLRTEEDLYHAIGSGKYSPITYITMLTKDEKDKEQIALEKVVNVNIKVPESRNDIIVEGIDDIKVNFANCCNPVKGDDVIGYITKGNGINVHRKNCPNIANLNERVIDVRWNENSNKKFLSNLLIYADKNENLLVDIIGKTSGSNITIQSVNTISNVDYNLFDLNILVENQGKLNKYITDLENITAIQKIERKIR